MRMRACVRVCAFAHLCEYECVCVCVRTRTCVHARVLCVFACACRRICVCVFLRGCVPAWVCPSMCYG